MKKGLYKKNILIKKEKILSYKTIIKKNYLINSTGKDQYLIIQK